MSFLKVEVYVQIERHHLSFLLGMTFDQVYPHSMLKGIFEIKNFVVKKKNSSVQIELNFIF